MSDVLVLPASPFEAPWVLPQWHDRIRVAPAPDGCRVWGREVIGQCWLWLGWNNGKGHSVVQIKGRRLYLHRYSLACFHGVEVHHLDTVDHLCRNRSCFNPQHVEPVTPIENHIRGDGPKHQFKRAEEYQSALSNDDIDALIRGF